MEYKLNLQMFAEEGTAPAEAAGTDAGGAEAAGAAETADTPVISAGDTLPGGGKASAQVAAAMNRQMQRHPELRKVYGRTGAAKAAAQPAQPGAEPGETIEQRWDMAKKGEFAELYGRDVQNAIRERFKNQSDANAELNKFEPMLKVLRERAGVETNDELIHHVMDDDSLYEDAANEAGMTVPAYKQFLQIKKERDAAQAREAEDQRKAQINQHFQKLVQQAENLKQSYPDFDLKKELENPVFFRMTTPEVGLSVEDAYFAVHHKELGPQMMAYGMQRAKVQMGQTLQARGKRPAEGAMKAQGQPAADIRVDPRKLSRSERNRLYEMVHKGNKLTFD